MTKDEALQMCLEYIETNAHERRHVRWAIKEAVAQPEFLSTNEADIDQLIEERDVVEDILDSVLDMVLGTDRPEWSSSYQYIDAVEGVREALAQPEPVAWMCNAPDGFPCELTHHDECENPIPLYTTPPQRPWVGLTHKEMYDVIRPLCSADEMATWLLEISEDEYLAIEAKLKEKNT